MRRDSSRLRKKRRIPLDFEVLEARVPVSEQIGTILALSTLYNASAVLARRVSPLVLDHSPLPKAVGSESLHGPALLSVPAPGGVTAADRLVLVPPEGVLSPRAANEQSARHHFADVTMLDQKLFSDLAEDPADLSLNADPARHKAAHRPNNPDADDGARRAGGTSGSPADAAGGSTAPTSSFIHETQAAAPGYFQELPRIPFAGAPSASAVPASLGGSDPGLTTASQLWVLDANKAIVVTPGITQHDFSNWNVDLRAQVSGATVSTYSWDLTQAADATNVSGQTAYRLTFTWASFTGAAHTDTVRITATNTDSTQNIQTLTFRVASTTSPAYSNVSPTTVSTWPTVLPADAPNPDALSYRGRCGCSGPKPDPGPGVPIPVPCRGGYDSGGNPAGATPDFQLGRIDFDIDSLIAQNLNYGLANATGSVRAGATLPQYHPQIVPLRVIYDSIAANAQPIFIVHYALDPTQTVPPTASAQLTLNGTAGQQFYYDTSLLNPGDIMEIALEGNATGLASGRYSYQIAVTANYAQPVTTTYSGSVNILNYNSSSFGAGWSLLNLERLWPVSGGVVLDRGAGQSLWFASSGGGFVSPPGDSSTLVQNGDSTYTRTLKDGRKINFTSSGRQTSVVDTNGNTTGYGYNGSNQLVTITDLNNQITTLAYNAGGQVSSINDPANRVTTLSYDPSARLTSLQTPDAAQWSYGYDSANRMTTLTNPLAKTVTFAYNFAGRLATVTRPDNTTEQLTALQMQGLVQPGSGTQTNPAPSVLAAQAQASYTDPRNNVWQSSFDWLGFGRASQALDPLSDMSGSYRDANGLAWLVSDPLGNRTRNFFDSNGNPTKIARADDTTQQYTYNSFSEATRYIDPLGNRTTYSYDSAGNRTSVKDALNNLTTYTYTAKGFVATQTDPLLHTTSYGYDSLSRQITTTDPLNGVTSYAYDTAGRQISVTDPRGDVTSYSYDAINRLTAVTDALANVTTSIYDAAGNLTARVDPLNHRTTFAYDAMNRRIQTTDALGNLSTTVYDSAGNVSARVDALVHRTSYTYDAANRRIQTTDALGNPSTTVYDAASNVAATVDPLNHRTTYTYDAMKRQVQLTDTMGNLSTNVYDGAGNVAARVDPLGNRTTSTYDAANRVIQTTDALGNLSTTVYDAAGNVAASVDTLNRRTTYTYDTLNRAIQTTDAMGNLSTTVYDAAGNVAATADALNHRASYTYDAANQRVQTTDALGNLSTTVYDGAGNIAVSVDALNRRTTYTYDALNRRIQATDALGNLSTTVYDAAGNVAATIDARGNRTTLTYDALNRAIASTDPLNHTTTTVYDSAGNVVKTIDPLSFITTYVYDVLNRPIYVQDPGGGITTTVYDAASNVVNSIDPLNQKTTYVYDASNRRTQTIDPRGGVVTTVYDAVGNTVNVIDPVGNKTTMVYDALNRLVQQTDPLNRSATLAYDAASRLTSTTDRNGRRRDFGYDNVNRRTSESWVASGSTVMTVTYTYDADGNQLTAANANGIYTYTYAMGYDALNRVTTTQEPFGLTLTATYDAVGNRTLLQDSLSSVTTSVYDAANRLTSRQFGGTGQTPLRIDPTYTSRDQLASLTRYSDLAGTQKTGSSVYTYDSVSRLSNLQHKNATDALLANYTYTYDLASRVLTETLNSSTTTYSYDSTNQLTNDSTATYTYDLNGNRTMTGYQTGSANQLTNDGTWTYTYDNEGSLIKKSKGTNAETWTYGYDNLNHLTSTQQRQTDGGTLLMQATYTYDAFGNRLEKDVWTSASGTTAVTRFAYDRSKVWADLDGTSSLQTRRLYLDGVDRLFARISFSGTAAWYLPDRLGSVRDISDSTGSIQDHLTYDGFGNATESNPNFGDRYKWTGREVDSETGLQYNRARYYDPKIGRWMQQDPIGYAAGDSNLYRYVRNGPTNATDPSGLEDFELSIKQVEKAQGGQFGAFAWPINWQLNKKSHFPEGGMIVQLVKVTTALKWVSGPFQDKGFAHGVFGSGKIATSWYEAWGVSPDSKTSSQQGKVDAKFLPVYQQDGITMNLDQLANDWYLLPDAGRNLKGNKTPGYANSYGSIEVVGKVAYYDCLTKEKLIELNFKQGNKFTGAGQLLSYFLGGGNTGEKVKKLLDEWTRKSAEIDHSLTATWDKDGAVKVKTTPEAP